MQTVLITELNVVIIMKPFFQGGLAFLAVVWINLHVIEGFCGDRSLDLDLVQLAVQSGEWLKDWRNENGKFGNGHESGEVFFALKLLGFSLSDSSSSYLKSELDKANITDISPGQLGHYVHGVLSTCGNPKKFHSHKLVRHLVDALTLSQGTSNFEYSMAVLALCNSGHHVKKHFTKILAMRLKTLVKYKSKQNPNPFDPDAVSMGIVALACVYKKEPQRNELYQAINESIHYLLEETQEKDGSFGNEITTALVVQAILAANETEKDVYLWRLIKEKWSCEKSMKFIIDKKAHWFKKNIMSTSHILPSLIGAVLFDSKKLGCQAPKPIAKDIDVCVKLVCEENSIGGEKTYCSEVPNNTNAFKILKNAAKTDSFFKHEVVKSSYGHMITEMCGKPNDPGKNKYWMIYATDEKLASHGIDDFYPEDGSTVIFKYKS